VRNGASGSPSGAAGSPFSPTGDAARSSRSRDSVSSPLRPGVVATAIAAHQLVSKSPAAGVAGASGAGVYHLGYQTHYDEAHEHDGERQLYCKSPFLLSGRPATNASFGPPYSYCDKTAEASWNHKKDQWQQGSSFAATADQETQQQIQSSEGDQGTAPVSFLEAAATRMGHMATRRAAVSCPLSSFECAVERQPDSLVELTMLQGYQHSRFLQPRCGVVSLLLLPLRVNKARALM
ncbi:unnamed protein product, partial [Amoebophrya sp. A25]